MSIHQFALSNRTKVRRQQGLNLLSHKTVDLQQFGQWIVANDFLVIATLLDQLMFDGVLDQHLNHLIAKKPVFRMDVKKPSHLVGDTVSRDHK